MNLLEKTAVRSPMRIIPPKRAWLIFNVVTFSVLLATGFAVVRFSGAENQKLINSQRDTLTRSRLSDLSRGDYRSFVEGIGRAFSELFVQITSPENHFESGKKAASSHCSSGQIELFREAKPVKLVIEMCRPYESPIGFFLFLGLLYLLASLFSFRLISVLERSSFEALSNFFKNAGVQAGSSKGLFGLLTGIRNLTDELTNARLKEIESAKSVAIGQMATQVAHDIRAPLMALSVVLEDISQLPEASQRLARSAVARVNDIANSLMERQRDLIARDSDLIESSEPLSVQLVATFLENIVSEKIVTFQGRPGLEIRLQRGVTSYGLFAELQPVEFARLLSNLINNSVDAIPEAGTIIVSARRSADSVIVEVSDTGIGIADEHVPKLGSRGATFEKIDGTGLGLFHAKTTIESWGGHLEIESSDGKGTKVRLVIPEAHPPEWFVREIVVEEGQTIVVVDDDVSVHQIWHERFKEISNQGTNIKEVHLSSLGELRSYVGGESHAKQSTYLIDHHFAGTSENGLTAITDLNLVGSSILVTGNHEAPTILSECCRLGIGLLPKAMAGFVPIETVGLRT